LSGTGILEWGGNGEGMGMERSVYKQPGTEVDGILSQQGGFQVSKGKWKGGKKELEKGKQKARGLLHNCVVNLYVCMYIMIACNCLNVANLYVCI
jgi:hypothetical protein